MTSSNGSALIVLGHGSRLREANDTLREVAARIKAAGYGKVVPAFLQMERPCFQEAVEALAGEGFREITVVPYFLYTGAHVTEDLPREIEEANGKYPGMRFDVTRCLGLHDKLIDIVIERVDEAGGGKRLSHGGFSQHAIEKESFRIIEEELGPTGFSDEELSVVKRVIHTTADFEFRDIIRFSPGAAGLGISAIRRGSAIITDVRMVEAGVAKKWLSAFGSRVLCFSSDPDVQREAARSGSTKTSAGMRKALPYLEGSIVAVGNAPTALLELLRLMDEGSPRPSLVIGVPVGFVGAREAKEALMRSGLPYVATEGRKGGSTVAVAIVNALIIEALKSAATGT